MLRYFLLPFYLLGFLTLMVGCSETSGLNLEEKALQLEVQNEDFRSKIANIYATTPRQSEILTEIDSLKQTVDEPGLIYVIDYDFDDQKLSTRELSISSLDNYERIEDKSATLEAKLINNLNKPLSERLSPELFNIIERNTSSDSKETFNCIVSFEDDLVLPVLPQNIDNEDMFSEQNQLAKNKRERIANLLYEYRSIQNEKRLNYYKKLIPIRGGTLLSWLINSIELELNVDEIKFLLNHSDVKYIELNQFVNIEPVDFLINSSENSISLRDPSGDHNDIIDGRNIINSDLYSGYINNNFQIGLVDTGLANHTLLTNPSIVTYNRDCVHGTDNYCSTGPGWTTLDRCNHGSSTASIIAGNSNMGNTHRGVATGVTFNSYKVYDTDVDSTGSCHGNNTLFSKGFSAAALDGNKVIASVIQNVAGESSVMSLIVDALFDLGVATVSIAGNHGSSAGSVSSPGNAHKTITEGVFDIRDGSHVYMKSYSGRGPAPDGRIKPDIAAPSHSLAADVSDLINNPSKLHGFTGTCGGLGYAAGGAILAKDFIKTNNNYTEPGYLYAFMIASTQYSLMSNSYGAGTFHMPDSPGRLIIGKVTIGQSQTITIPFSVTSPVADVRASIWWPEGSSDTHKYIKLSLTRSDGVSASSQNTTSIWQKIAWHSSLTGQWNIKLISDSLNETRTVYYVINIEN